MYVRSMSIGEPPTSVGMPAPTPAGALPIAAQLGDDEELSKTDLIEVIAHCAATTATAQFRMLQAISLIHEEHEEDYGHDVGRHTTGQADSAAAIAEHAARGRAGENPRAEFGPDGLERTIADIGAVLSVPPRQARDLIVTAHALRYRLPQTAGALACGRIDLRRFTIAVARTELCSPEHIRDVDTEIALAVFSRDQMSLTRYTAMIDAIVTRIDDAAPRRRRELVESDRNIRIRPDRFTTGQARVSGTLPVTSGVRVDARLTAMADSVHDADPRTRTQRRADALIALAEGHDTLACRCPACVTAIESGAAAPTPDTPASPRAIIHVVANQSTLDGDDDEPGYLDGYGVIDAATVGELMAGAEFELLHPDHAQSARAALRYTPSRKLDALIRSGELCCSFPGCTNPVWRTDLDHTVPFDHKDPTRGGKTKRHNIKPVCRFHHRVKTFGSWRDYQLAMNTSIFQSPTGHWFVGNSFTGLDLFPRLRDKPPDHPARRTIDTMHARRRAIAERAQQEWDDANPPPF